jgi:hypothetical protein
MRNIEGVLMRWYEKTVNGARGPSIAYNGLVNTGQGEEWFSFGFKKPAITEGQQVKFVVVQKGNFWNVDVDTVEVIKTEAAAAPAVMAKAVANVNNTQRSIVLQSAYERSILLINGALTHGAIKLPTKVADKFDTYCTLVEETAFHLAELFINPPSDFTATGSDAPAMDVSEGEPPVATAEGYNVV